MSDWDDAEKNEPTSPEELCKQAFSRCSNWPEDYAGQIGLAQGLNRASERFRVSKEDLIEKCRELSAFCPTDADLLRVAGEMFTARQSAFEASRDQITEWRKQYGPPKPFDQHGKCTCCGRDWTEIIKTSTGRRAAKWAALRAHFDVKKGKWPSYRDMAPVARQLGYTDYAEAWERL